MRQLYARATPRRGRTRDAGEAVPASLHELAPIRRRSSRRHCRRSPTGEHSDPRLRGAAAHAAARDAAAGADDGDLHRHHCASSSTGRGCLIVRAFAEAGMVGACADWFAVVALFRRPLGLPIPHTGIVPNNKDRIGGALGRFITNNFLTARGDERKAWRASTSSARSRVGSTNRPMPSGSATMSRCNCRGLSRSLPGPRIGELVGKIAQQASTRVPAAPVASKLLGDRLGARRGAGADRAGDRTRAKAGSPATRIIFTRQDRAAIVALDPEMDRQDDRRQGDERRARHARRNARSRASLARRAAQDGGEADRRARHRSADACARARTSRPNCWPSPLLIEQAKTLWSEVETRPQCGHCRRTRRPSAQACAQALRSVGTLAARGPKSARTQLNRRIRAVGAALSAALSRRDRRLYRARGAQLGHRDAWSTGWSCRSARICNIIRINGTLVGGLVGLLIFIVSKWIAQF